MALSIIQNKILMRPLGREVTVDKWLFAVLHALKWHVEERRQIFLFPPLDSRIDKDQKSNLSKDRVGAEKASKFAYLSRWNLVYICAG